MGIWKSIKITGSKNNPWSNRQCSQNKPINAGANSTHGEEVADRTNENQHKI